MSTGIVIQARNGSTRLPDKAIIDIGGKPALKRMIDRLQQAEIKKIIVATTMQNKDDSIESLCVENKINCFRGSENDVLRRVTEACIAFKIDTMIELTGDCPFIDPNHINGMIKLHKDTGADLTTNVFPRSFPVGFDIRIVDTSLLKKIEKEVDNEVDRQHVLTWIYLNPKNRGKYKIVNYKADLHETRPDLEITLDTPQDLELIRFLQGYGEEYRLEMTCNDIINAINTYPDCYKKVKNEVKRKDYFEELYNEYERQKKIPKKITKKHQETKKVNSVRSNKRKK